MDSSQDSPMTHMPAKSIMKMIPKKTTGLKQTGQYSSEVFETLWCRLFDSLAEEQDLRILENLILRAANEVARQSISEDGKKAARTSAQEFFKGSYDAVEEKWQEKIAKVPRSAKVALAGLAALLVALLAGLTVATWRFALVGLS